MYLIAIAIIVIVIVIIAIIAAANSDYPDSIFEPPERLAGRRGEEIASNVIRKVLRDGDCLFTNVEISFEDKRTELDNVVVNKYGVFIIEVKNYNGRLVGSEDDYEWQKYHTTDAGNAYVKTVKNPIKQVKRQIYILARFLDYYGEKVWVSGYAILLQGNSSVDSEYILSSLGDIDRAIHTRGRNRLDLRTVEAVAKLLS